jgi:hypothetical protein
MTNFSNLETYSSVATIIAGNANITAAQIRDRKFGQWWKPADIYLIDMLGDPAIPEGIDNTSREFDTAVVIYIKGTGATPEADFIKKCSYIEDTWTAQTTANKFYDFLGIERIGKWGKNYVGYVTLVTETYNVVSGYT